MSFFNGKSIKFSLTTKSLYLYLLPALFITGLLYSFIVPPFQSPDEFSHIQRAYMLSKGRIVMTTPVGENTGSLIDTGLNAYMVEFNYLPFHVEKKLTADVQKKASGITWSKEENFNPAPGVNNYFPLIYTPQAIGLWVGQSINMSVQHTYYLARYFSLFFALLILITAFNIYRPNLYVVGILLMPLMIFQFVSASQDALAIALVVLAVSIFMKITKRRDEFSGRYFWLMCLCILLITTSRINMLPMLLLPFAAVFIARKGAKDYMVSSAVMILTFLWIIYALSTTVDNRIAVESQPSEIIYYYLKNPFAFIFVVIDTLNSSQTMQFYVSSFVGLLGWLDTSIGFTYIVVIFFALMALLVVSVSFKTIKEEIAPRAVLFSVAIFSMLLTFFLLLISWNEHPAQKIEGVQGRYFWAAAIILGYALCICIKEKDNFKKWIARGALLTIVVINVVILPKVLVERYYLEANHESGSDQSIGSAKKIFKEVESTINLNKANADPEKGGFIDESEYSDGSLILSGWGYFSQDEKTFYSNGIKNISIKFVTVERPDVVNALDDTKLMNSGFRIKIAAPSLDEAKKIMDKICLYTNDPIYGLKQLHKGDLATLYTCMK